MALLQYSPGGGVRVVGSAKGGNSYPPVPYGAVRGNVLIVDSVYGNDASAYAGGTSYSSVGAAIAAATSGQTIYILPGTYALTSGITIPNGVSIRGMSLQTCILQLNVTGSATLITMGEGCRVEDLTLNLTCTGSTDNVVLKGIVFGGTSSQTSKLRVCVVNVRNSAMATSLTSTVTGIEGSGTGLLNPSTFSFNSIKGSTINVYSNGKGNKRGILISGSNQFSTRDTNVYVAQPTDTTSTGSYVGVETADQTSGGSIQLRSTTVGTVTPTASQSYTASDILQSTPATVANPTYLASAGIQIGPGTDLVTKTAGGKGFSTYVYPTIIYFGLKGTITSAGSGGWLWPGTQGLSAGTFPDPGLPPAYFRVQQPCILSGMSAGLNVSPGGTYTVTLTVYYTPIANLTTFNGYISGTTLTVTSGLVGTILSNQYLVGPGVTSGTTIVSGSGSTWTVSPSQNIGSSVSPVAFRANLAIATPFTITFNGTDYSQSFYNASVNLNAGDLIHLYSTYTSGSPSNVAHDITCQVDLF
jgi:hypothetical protein